MTCKFQYLKREQFDQIHQCFLEAFADYHLDMSYMTKESLFNRLIKNGIDFESSVGVFDDGKMVGFTMIGIDRWKIDLAAFDTGTGIIPAYRGHGIARKMFDYAIPKLKNQGVKKFLLEVLQVNKMAVKAYSKTGFNISREFDCFEIEVENFKFLPKENEVITLKPVTKEKLSFFSEHLDWQPSWENSFSSIQRIPDEVMLYGAFSDSQLIGLLVYYPGLKWIMSLLVIKSFRRQGVAGQLLAQCIKHLPGDVNTIKLVNVEHSDKGTAMKNLLIKHGFKLFVTQYEMEFDI
jgi:ribosomal protein S18 acetylase RimI-like enzyme